MSSNIEIFVGTYDSYLLSYKLINQNGKFFLERYVSQNTHTSSVRCVNSGGRYLATGGSDDRIVVMDLKKNQEIQMLTHHSGTVNQVEFSPDGKFLFSASDDGSLAATKIGSWITDNVWRTPHSGKAITFFAIHPTGKLALSIGKDGTMRTWSLIKGRQVFTTNLKTLTPKGDTIEKVVWSPSGSQFVLISVDKVLVMSVGSASVVRAFDGVRTTCVCWLSDDMLLLGQMDGKIRFVEIEGDYSVLLDAHETRIKDMVLLNEFLVTISSHGSDGQITVWHLDRDDLSLSEMCGTTLNRRPICLAVVDASLYRPEIEVKAEQSAEAVSSGSSARKGDSARRMVTAGRVTIENDEDDTPCTSTVSLLQATAPRKSKKRKSKVVQPESDPESEDQGHRDDDDDVDEPTPPKQSRKNRISLLSSDKKKLHKSKPSGFLETSMGSTTPKSNNKKRSNADENDDAERTPVQPKKSKKDKKNAQTKLRNAKPTGDDDDSS